MSAPLLRPLAFGEVLDVAFTLYRRNFGTFVAAALGPSLVMLAVVFLTGMHDAAGDPEAMSAGGFLLFMVTVMVGTLVMWGALTHLASRAYGGSPAPAAEGLAVALRRFPAMLGALLVLGVAGFAVFFALAMVMGVMAAIMAGAGGAGAVGIGVLTVVIMVTMFVGYVLGAGLFFALIPAVVLEGKGPISAIWRSVSLARGALWRLIGLMLVTFFIVYLPILGTLVLTGTFSTLYDPEAAAAASGSTAYILQQVVSWGAGAITTPFLLCVIVVQYYDRRVRTEALDVQAAADRLAIA